MREIKFRALAHHNNGDKEWFYYTPKTGKIITDMYINNKIRRWVVEDSQYIGLKDKNSKEIYEGDVLGEPEGDFCSDESYEVVFRDGEFKFKNLRTKTIVSNWKIRDYCEHFEIKGNIYENPDLLPKE